jgi:AraC-like DNA-binding protein
VVKFFLISSGKAGYVNTNYQDKFMRVWEVPFEVHMPFSSLPRPGIIVEEVQNSPDYGHEGCNRRDAGGQLSITIAGRGRLRIGKEHHDLTPGMAFLHNHRDHNIGYYYPADGNDTWRFLWIAFYGNSEAITADFNKRYGYIYQLPLDGIIVKKLAAFRNLRDVLQVRTPLAGAKLIMDIFAGLGDTFEHELIRNPQSMLVSKVQQYVIENISSELTVGVIASNFNVSREHLTRVFRTQTGMTPHSYITQRRMLLARELLLQTRLSCKEIADRVGYSDLSVFSRAFKATLKMSPSAIRESGIRPNIP